MKKYDYYRPAARPAGRRKNLRKKPSFSFLKPILLLCVLLGLCAGGYGCAVRVYRAWTASRLGQWKPAAVAVSGVSGTLAKELQDLGGQKLAAPFSAADAAALRRELAAHYPQLKDIQVRRGLFSGTLGVTVRRRVPVARFVRAGGQLRWVDEDGTVYADAHPDPLLSVPQVEADTAEGEAWPAPWVEFVQLVWKGKEKLEFARLYFSAEPDRVQLDLPDGSVIDFGPARQLRAKLRRARQIEALARRDGQEAHELDFTYFEDGKVFLRQKAR